MTARRSVRAGWVPGLALAIGVSLWGWTASGAPGQGAAGGRGGTGDDLVDRPWAAHVRAGGLLIDLGTRSSYKHTLEDRASGWSRDQAAAGIDYSSVVGPRATVAFDAFAEEAGGGSILVALRGGTAEGASLELNGVEIGWLEAPRDEFAVVELFFEEGIVGGRNVLTIEPDESVASVEQAHHALDVDYLLIVPDNGRAADGPPRMPPAIADRDGLAICAGCGLTFNLVLGDRRRLEVLAAADAGGAPGALEVTVRTEPGAIALRSRVEPAPGARTASLPLDALAGRAVSITFTAHGAPLVLRSAVLRGTAEPAPPPPAPGARNLLVVLVDTLRADRLKIYNGATRVQTPNLSRFARSAVVFERASAPESWTKPSVASLLTGLYPERHTVRSHGAALPATVPFAPQLLGAQGLETAAFVGNGYLSREHGFARDWDHFQSFDGLQGANTARHIVSAAIRWLRRRPEGQRFFAYVHTVDPHAPYTAPVGFRHRYVKRPYRGGVRPALTARLLREHAGGALALHPRDVQWLEDLYDGEVSFNDFHLGRLLDALRGAGLQRETLVVVTADHGEEFLEHGHLGHGQSVYEELVHVPLLVRWPAAATGARVTSEVSLVDVLPTACELLAVECDAGLDGASLSALASDRTARAGAPSFAGAAGSRTRAARVGDFKLVCRGLDCALFDLGLDPGETTDAGPREPITAAALRDALGDHLWRVRAPAGTAARSATQPEDAMGRNVEIDGETRRQLVALGYLDD